MRLIAVLTVAVLALCACSYPHYVPPDARRPTASLKLIADETADSVRILFYRNPNCESPEWIGVIGHVQGPSAPPTDSIKVAPVEVSKPIPISPTKDVTVEAGRSLYIRMDAGYPTKRQCRLTFSFYPEPAAFYEARYFEDANQCGVEMHRVFALSGGSVSKVRERSFQGSVLQCRN